MSRTLTTIAVTALSLSLFACSDESTAPDPVEAAPELPPTSTMQMDFGFFSPGARTALGTAGAESAAHWNWINAIVRVTAIQLITLEVLGPPATAFGLALGTEPEKVDRDTWRWEYTWREGGENATIELEGSWAVNGVDWMLWVSGNVDGQTFDHDLWYRGHSSLDGHTGHWIFTDLEDDPSEVARLDWSSSGISGDELELGIIDPESPDFGDHIAFSSAGSTCTVEWTDESENDVSFVTWDENTGVGSLQVPDYNEGRRACWDEDQEDTTCPGGGVAS